MDSVFQLSMELYDTKTSKVLWSESCQKAWDELASIKGMLADNILKTLKVSTKQDIVKAPTTNTEAYKYYLEAKYIYEKRENLKDTEITRGLLQKAIELDDNLISAKLLLGESYIEMGDYDKAMEIFNSALIKAEELDDKLWIGRSNRKIGNVSHNKGDYDTSEDYWKRALAIAENIGDKFGIGACLNNIGIVYRIKGDYDKAFSHLQKVVNLQKEIGPLELETVTLFALAKTSLGKEYDKDEILELIKESENIEFKLNYAIYQLLEDASYIETAYKQVQEKVDEIDDELKLKLLSYPIPKAIVEE